MGGYIYVYIYIYIYTYIYIYIGSIGERKWSSYVIAVEEIVWQA